MTKFLSRRNFLRGGLALTSVIAATTSVSGHKANKQGQHLLRLPPPLPQIPAAIAKVKEMPDPKKASFVIDAESAEVFHKENESELRYPASLTKLMTLYMVFEALQRGNLTLAQQLPVSLHAEQQENNKLALKHGHSISVESVIRGMIIFSANDAAVVAGEYLGGSETTFGADMTQKARELGMKDTVFRNASGWHDPDQVTTAYDMAILVTRLRWEFPKYASYFKEPNFPFHGLLYERHDDVMFGHDGRYHVDPDPRVQMAKTGFFGVCGFHIAAVASTAGRDFIIVVMGERTEAERAVKFEALLNNAVAQKPTLLPPKPQMVPDPVL